MLLWLSWGQSFCLLLSAFRLLTCSRPPRLANLGEDEDAEREIDRAEREQNVIAHEGRARVAPVERKAAEVCENLRAAGREVRNAEVTRRFAPRHQVGRP